MKHRSWRILPLALIIFLYGFCTLFCVNAQVWNGNVASSFALGSGTESDPYVINTADQLAYLAKSTNGSNTYNGIYFILDNDIALNDESFVFDRDTGLVRVSDGTNTAYLGTGIKGDNSKSNTVFDTAASEVGAWYASDTSKTKGSYTGTINTWTPIGNADTRFEGDFDGKGHTVSGIYVNNEASYGGLFGYTSALLENIKIEDSYIHAGEFTGTVAGSNLYKTTGCFANATVCSSQNNVGGVIGKGGTVQECLNYSTVVGAQSVGGIAGNAKVEKCCNNGNVYGDTGVGGIVGNGRGLDNLNTASVYGVESVGGICGSVSTVLSTSYNSGTVLGEKYVGSVLGRLVEGSVTDCYYLKNCATDASGKIQNGFGASENGKSRSDSTGVTCGLDASQIKLTSSFEGFDFENVWTITSGGTPVLIALQSETHAHVYDNACDTTCNTCNETRTVSHSFKSEWMSDGDGHWHECSVCSHKTDENAHILGEPATQSSPQICTVCSFVITPALTHEHEYPKEWEKDETSHWHECQCGEKSELFVHSYDNSCDTTCNVCGSVRDITHEYQTVWTVNTDSHWHKCSVCGAISNEGDHKYDNSCDAQCNDCGYKRTVDHKYQTEWSKDSVSHWHECSVCADKKDTEAHGYDNSCDTDCNICGYEREVSHTYKSTLSVNDISHWYECVVCFVKKDFEQHFYDNSCDNACDGCGYEREVAHSYKEEWLVDENGHWHECSVCFEKKDQSAHVGGAAATETTPQTCTVCSYELAPVLGHTHKFSNAWTNDEENHWYLCACGEKDSFFAHRYDNSCDTVCNDCYFVRTVTHSYQSAWSTSQIEHWHECVVCGKKKDVGTHVAGDKATETAPQICTVCSYVIAPPLGHTHSFGDTWINDGTSHWKQCSCGDKTELSSHGYDNACDTTCNTCTYERSVTHSYKTRWSTDKNSHWHECSVCGSKKDEAAHVHGANATETTPQICTVCAFVITPPIGHRHNYSSAWSSDGTNHWHLCSCGAKGDIESHKFENACDTVCDVCGHERSAKHTYGENAMYDDKSHWLECSVCYDKKQSEIHVFNNLCDTTCNGCAHTRKITHVYDGKWSWGDDAHWHKCLLCNAESEKAQHSWDSGTVTKEPTAYEDGIKTYKCADCAFTKTESIAKLPSVNTDATTTTGTNVTTEPITSDTTEVTDHATTTKSPQTSRDTQQIADTQPSADDTDGGDGYLTLAIVLGVISVILLVTLLIMMLYVFKKKDK